VFARGLKRPRGPEHSARSAISASSHLLDEGEAAFLKRLAAASVESKRRGVKFRRVLEAGDYLADSAHKHGYDQPCQD
jgi:hypothetical protein